MATIGDIMRAQVELAEHLRTTYRAKAKFDKDKTFYRFRHKGVWVTVQWYTLSTLEGSYQVHVKPPSDYYEATRGMDDAARMEVFEQYYKAGEFVRWERELPKLLDEITSNYRAKATRTKRDYDSFEFEGHEGKDGFRYWQRELAQSILEDLTAQYRRFREAVDNYRQIRPSFGLSAADIADVNEFRFFREFETQSSQQRYRKDVRNVLSKLERAGKIEKEGKVWVNWPEDE